MTQASTLSRSNSSAGKSSVLVWGVERALNKLNVRVTHPKRSGIRPTSGERKRLRFISAGLHRPSPRLRVWLTPAWLSQIRVYGMKYFDETAAYWGDSFQKIILAGNNRLSVRSVKIFADGKPISHLRLFFCLGMLCPWRLLITLNPCALPCLGALRSGGAAVRSISSSPSNTLIILTRDSPLQSALWR